MTADQIMPTNRSSGKVEADDLKPEYDFSVLGEGIRGKYYERASTDANSGPLDPELATPSKPRRAGGRRKRARGDSPPD